MPVELPALSDLTVLRLHGIELNTGLPPSLQELFLEYCTVSSNLQLPATLQKLRVMKCDSDSSDITMIVNVEFRVHLNEGLQQAIIIIDRWRRADLGGDLPSTLTHLVLRDGSTSSLGPLPPGLQHLELNRKLTEPLGPLPDTLQVLKLGTRYEQPLDVFA
jgi:hypothetical protein